MPQGALAHFLLLLTAGFALPRTLIKVDMLMIWFAGEWVQMSVERIYGELARVSKSENPAMGCIECEEPEACKDSIVLSRSFRLVAMGTNV